MDLTTLDKPESRPEHPSNGKSDATTGPLPVDESEVLDWDAMIDPPPPRRAGTARVRLVYGERKRGRNEFFSLVE